MNIFESLTLLLSLIIANKFGQHVQLCFLDCQTVSSDDRHATRAYVTGFDTIIPSIQYFIHRYSDYR